MQNTVLKYLEETAQKYPDKDAIVDKNEKISFKEFRKRAILIGKTIQLKINRIHKPILVYLPKSIDSIVSFMGVLYSGNFYTPTDVNFPFDKVKGIINCLEPSLFITNREYSTKLIKNGICEEKLLILEDVEADVEKTELLFLNDIVDTDVVYVLFTSGSTGVPKGVVISNRSIIDYIDWAKKCYDINSNDSIGNQAPFYFDNSTLDIYLMISTGATLYIIPENLFSFPVKLMNYICENEIDTIFWVPSVYINVANADILSTINAVCLKKILFAGEVMPNKHLNYWRKHIPNALYSNLYGPTEITVDCTYYIVNRNFKDEEPLPIGIPCTNSNVMLLNDRNQLIQAQDEMGELCVRGSSLALGYWNNLDKTNEVFVQNPLNHMYPEKIYRTGDLAHYNEYGELMFDGRRDFQIKHMGYRIELGEIETAVLGINEIGEACVIYDKDKRDIVLYYSGEDAIDKKLIRKELMQRIPKYMIPTKFMRKKVLPKNDNGKIDRKELEKDYALKKEEEHFGL